MDHLPHMIIIIIIPCEFFTPALADDFSLESESLQVSRTLLSIQAGLDNAVVWLVFTCPLNCKYSSPFKKAFGDCSECANYNWYHRHCHVQ